MEDITQFFLEKLITDGRYGTAKPVDDQTLLLPRFLNKLETCISIYKLEYPNQSITFTETYRSNLLQYKYFEQGASKTKEDGMHHYGIAADCIFIINEKRSYEGDTVLLRKIYVENGLTILGMWDPLHVQLIPVGQQMQLRNAVISKIKAFQSEQGIPITGLPDEITIAKARSLLL